MAKIAPGFTIFTLFASFWLITAVVPVYGAGSRDIDLSRADQLISEKEYDQAIEFLTDFARRNPDQFDQAQARLNRIYQLREEFNRTADLLIEILLERPDDDEAILELTTKLRSLENDNSPVLVDFLSRIHEIALFNVSRTQLRRALENGRNMLDRNNFDGALQAYNAGFTIMRDEFYAADYGSDFFNQTNRELERVYNAINSYRQISSQLESLASELTRTVNSGQHARVGDIMSRMIPVMDRYIAEKHNINAAVAVFENQLQNLQRNNPSMGDRNYLAFVIRVIYGRTDADIQEGILGVFDAFWKRSVGVCLDTIAQYIETTYNTGLASFNRGNYSETAAVLSGISYYNDVIPVFFDKQRLLTQVTIAQTVVFDDFAIQRDSLQQYLKIVSLNEASSALEQVAVIPGRDQYDRSTLVNLRARRITAQQALSEEQRTREILTAQRVEIETIKANAVLKDAEISVHHEFPYIKNVIQAIDGLFGRIAEEEQQSALRFYSIAQIDIDNNISQLKGQLDRAENFLEGESRNPAQAVMLLTPLLASANEDLSRSGALLTQFRNEPSNIASNTEIRTITNNFQTSIAELTAIRDQGQAMLYTASRNVGHAEALRQEAERLFNEAQLAFQRRDYETASSRLDSATQRLDESLALLESEEAREFRDVRILRLSEQIVMAQYDTVVAEVRNLVDTARNQYFEGNFQRAEENLLRARNRWRLINLTEGNPEVEYWLDMIARAMSASSARVVLPTAPLYPEISQLLSQARRNYEEGVRLINAGRRAEGLARFAEAQVQTREVKLMFPVNQEAGILDLRIEQFTDPAAFNAAFAQRLQTARTGTQRGSFEAYGDLLNLAEINPNYPGIRDIVIQAEIDLRLRPPPPNPQDIARSRELTLEASRILDQNLIAQFPFALAQINEAIALDPNNTNATRIKDRLLSRSNTTEPSAHVLSSADEALYQQAVLDHQAGNNLVAYANIERILQNPRNRNVAKVIELQRRVRQALGI